MQDDPKLEFFSTDEKVVEKVQKGLTSQEAAALLLSEGRTSNVQEAEMLASAQEFDMDAIMRSGLRRQMGFDFQIKTSPRKLYVLAKDGPKVHTHAKVKEGEMDEYGNIISEDLIARLVDACVRLKVKWDEANAAKAGAKR